MHLEHAELRPKVRELILTDQTAWIDWANFLLESSDYMIRQLDLISGPIETFSTKVDELVLSRKMKRLAQRDAPLGTSHFKIAEWALANLLKLLKQRNQLGHNDVPFLLAHRLKPVDMLSSLDLDLKIGTWWRVLTIINMVRTHGNDYATDQALFMVASREGTLDEEEEVDEEELIGRITAVFDELGGLVTDTGHIEHIHQGISMVEQHLDPAEGPYHFLHPWLTSLGWSYCCMYQEQFIVDPDEQ